MEPGFRLTFVGHRKPYSPSLLCCLSLLDPEAAPTLPGCRGKGRYPMGARGAGGCRQRAGPWPGIRAGAGQGKPNLPMPSSSTHRMSEVERCSPPHVPSLFHRKGKLRLLSDDSAQVSCPGLALSAAPGQKLRARLAWDPPRGQAALWAPWGTLPMRVCVCWCLGRTHLWWRLLRLGDHLGSQTRLVRPLRPVHRAGAGGGVPWHHLGEQHGFHRHHQIF